MKLRGFLLFHVNLLIDNTPINKPKNHILTLVKHLSQNLQSESSSFVHLFFGWYLTKNIKHCITLSKVIGQAGGKIEAAIHHLVGTENPKLNLHYGYTIYKRKWKGIELW